MFSFLNIIHFQRLFKHVHAFFLNFWCHERLLLTIIAVSLLRTNHVWSENQAKIHKECIAAASYSRETTTYFHPSCFFSCCRSHNIAPVTIRFPSKVLMRKRVTYSFTAQPPAVVDATLRRLHRCGLETPKTKKQNKTKTSSELSLLLNGKMKTRRETNTDLERQEREGVFDQEPH